MTGDGFGSTEQGWLIKGGGSGLVCRVPSAATFTLTNLNWVTPRWQTLDTKLRPQGFFPAIFYPRTLTALTAASYSESDFENWSGRWWSGVQWKCILGAVPWWLSCEETFGISKLFKQAARVTGCTQGSREQDLALTTPPGSRHQSIFECTCASVFFEDSDEMWFFFFLNRERRRECAARIKAQLNFGERWKFPLSLSHHPAFRDFQKLSVCN